MGLSRGGDGDEFHVGRAHEEGDSLIRKAAFARMDEDGVAVAGLRERFFDSAEGMVWADLEGAVGVCGGGPEVQRDAGERDDSGLRGG